MDPFLNRPNQVIILPTGAVRTASTAVETKGERVPESPGKIVGVYPIAKKPDPLALSPSTQKARELSPELFKSLQKAFYQQSGAAEVFGLM
jgi:hypothetical protein